MKFYGKLYVKRPLLYFVVILPFVENENATMKLCKTDSLGNINVNPPRLLIQPKSPQIVMN